MVEMPTPLPNVNGQSQYAFAAQQPGGFPVNLSYSGSLSVLPDVACARIGIAWEMRDGQIRIVPLHVQNVPLNGNTGRHVDGCKGRNVLIRLWLFRIDWRSATLVSANSTQNAGVNFTGFCLWKSVEDSIHAMLTQAQTGSIGGKVVTSRLWNGNRN